MLRGEASELYEDGRHYDCMFTTDGEHPSSFWVEQAEETGGSVLELACGTGAIAIPLARAGHYVTGLDLSEPMLAEARRKARAAGVQVDWRHGDIRDFRLGRRYSLIILASNVLCHLLDLPSLEDCLGRVREHLASDGRFVLSVFVPDPALLRRRCDEPHVLAELMALLHYNGFEVVDRWSDHERRPFGPDSGLQVLVCRAPRAAECGTP